MCTLWKTEKFTHLKKISSNLLFRKNVTFTNCLRKKRERRENEFLLFPQCYFTRQKTVEQPKFDFSSNQLHNAQYGQKYNHDFYRKINTFPSN